MKLLALLLLALLLAGCESTAPSTPTMVPSVGVPAEVAPARFHVEYAANFRCGVEDRESRRAIYVITDTTTGVSYLAVQGCGTSQLVTERQGKNTRTVER